MLMQQTIELLHTLRLTGMAAALEEQRGIPDIAGLAFDDRFALLLDREKLAREDRRLTRLLQLARFRHTACVEDVNFRVKRGLDRALFLRLASGDWIRQHQVTLLTGPTGTGKSWLACALGQAACRQGHLVRYTRMPRLLSDLSLARADGSWGKVLQQLAKTSLLVMDDWGLCPLGDRERRDLLEVIEDRKRYAVENHTIRFCPRPPPTYGSGWQCARPALRSQFSAGRAPPRLQAYCTRPLSSRDRGDPSTCIYS